MNKQEITNSSEKKSFPLKAAEFIVDNFLLISMWLFFTTIFKKLFGDSKIAGVVSMILSIPFASLIVYQINKSAAGFFIVALVSAPAFVLAIVFLFM